MQAIRFLAYKAKVYIYIYIYVYIYILSLQSSVFSLNKHGERKKLSQLKQAEEHLKLKSYDKSGCKA